MVGPALRTKTRTRSPVADLHRVVEVLVGDAVEDDVVGCGGGGRGLGQRGGLALGAEVPLALDDRELRVDRRAGPPSARR